MFLRALVVLTGAVLAGGCWPPCEDYGYTEFDTLLIREDDPVHAEAIDRCFASDFACERLCIDLLGPPPIETVRSIVECYVVRDGTGGLTVNAQSHLVKKCSEDDWGWNWDPDPDAARWLDGSRDTDAWREQIDATPPDAAPADAAL